MQFQRSVRLDLIVILVWDDYIKPALITLVYFILIWGLIVLIGIVLAKSSGYESSPGSGKSGDLVCEPDARNGVSCF